MSYAFTVTVGGFLAFVALTAGYLRRLKWIPMGTLWAGAVWSLRSWWNDYPVSLKLEDWAYPEDADETGAAVIRARNAWKFLAPFFKSHGLYLYIWKGEGKTVPQSHPLPAKEQGYPFARLYGTPSNWLVITVSWLASGDVCTHHWHPQKLQLWGARDRHGRDVIIKYVLWDPREAVALFSD